VFRRELLSARAALRAGRHRLEFVGELARLSRERAGFGDGLILRGPVLACRFRARFQLVNSSFALMRRP